MQSPDDLYVFFHINKTGGTTLTTHLQNCFKDQPLRTPMLNRYQRELALAENRVYWTERSFEEKMQARIIAGHGATPCNVSEIAPHRNIKYITFFRDPGSRIVSTFNYSRAMGSIDPDCDLLSYLKNTGFNSTQLRFFAHNFMDISQDQIDLMQSDHSQRQVMHEAVRLIENFYFIGLHESYDEDIKLLTSLLGIPEITRNYLVTGKDYAETTRYTPDLDNEIRELFPVEYEFYDAVKAIRAGRGPAISPDTDSPLNRTLNSVDVA